MLNKISVGDTITLKFPRRELIYTLTIVSDDKDEYSFLVSGYDDTGRKYTRERVYKDDALKYSTLRRPQNA